jgi:hypothetical protein
MVLGVDQGEGKENQAENKGLLKQQSRGASPCSEKFLRPSGEGNEAGFRWGG